MGKEQVWIQAERNLTLMSRTMPVEPLQTIILTMSVLTSCTVLKQIEFKEPKVKSIY